mmetsp:Transcript_2452/g.4064  ORF Transcript_2452/g.4064 Transcript_2452/m.4064 type:complete len:307 (+) Transcript_2452:21-941(+)
MGRPEVLVVVAVLRPSRRSKSPGGAYIKGPHPPRSHEWDAVLVRAVRRHCIRSGRRLSFAQALAYEHLQGIRNQHSRLTCESKSLQRSDSAVRSAWKFVKRERIKGRWDLFSFAPRKAVQEQEVQTTETGAAPGLFIRVIQLSVAGSGSTNRLYGVDLAWDHKIATVLNLRVGLITANAVISTLGGGHFLCKQIDAAEAMAKKQLRIAHQLGDPGLASQCRIHLAYNQIQRGNLDRARSILIHELFVAQHLEDKVLKLMIRSAWLYIEKLAAIQRELAKPSHNKVEDPLFRQRFVTDTDSIPRHAH